METISAIIIMKNEEERIARCLESLRWVDEIIVVDSGSDDKSCEIARRYTDHVCFREFDNYMAQKNYGASLAVCDWIISIDADEVVAAELGYEIQKLLADDKEKCDQYAVPRKNIYFGQEVTHVFHNDVPVRLYRRNRCRLSGEVHEKVVGGDSEGRLGSELLHYSCNTYREWVHKTRKYFRMQAGIKFREGQRFSFLRCFFSPFRVFILRYLYFKGWKDGWAGLFVSVELAFSTSLGEFELLKLSKRLR